MKNDVEEYVVVARQWQQPHDKLKKYNWREKKRERNGTKHKKFYSSLPSNARRVNLSRYRHGRVSVCKCIHNWMHEYKLALALENQRQTKCDDKKDLNAFLNTRDTRVRQREKKTTIFHCIAKCNAPGNCQVVHIVVTRDENERKRKWEKQNERSNRMHFARQH